MYVPPPSPRAPGWRRWDPCHVMEQVFNATKPTANVTPATDIRADAVKAAWLPRLPGQAVPMIGERLASGGPCDDR